MTICYRKKKTTSEILIETFIIRDGREYCKASTSYRSQHYVKVRNPRACRAEIMLKAKPKDGKLCYPRESPNSHWETTIIAEASLENPVWIEKGIGSASTDLELKPNSDGTEVIMNRFQERNSIGGYKPSVILTLELEVN